MASVLRLSLKSMSLYVPEGTGGGAWVGFVLPPGTAAPFGLDALFSDWAWATAASQDPPTVFGLWVFAPRAPADVPGFVNALWASKAGDAFNNNGQLTMPVWVPDPDASNLAVTFIPTMVESAPVTAADASLAFGGNFSFLIPNKSPYGYDAGSDSLWISAQGGFNLNVNGALISGFDQILILPLSGPQAGLLTLNGNLSFDPSLSGADLGIHFAYAGSGGGVTLRYPLFDIRASGPKIAYAVTLDPGAPYDGARTRLAFGAQTPALPSGFTSPSGQAVSLTPRPGAGLVIRSLYGSGGDSAFEPDGEFGVTLDPPTPGGSAALLCGSIGTEAATGSAGLSLTFAAGPAYCPFDPTAASTDAALPLDDVGGAALTAWVTAHAASGQVSYLSQPTQSALFQGGKDLGPFAFQVAPLPLVTGVALSSLPLAPYALADAQLNTIDTDAYQAFESHVLAPARARIVAAGAKLRLAGRRRTAAATAAATAATYVTGRGLVVAASGGAFTSVQLATTRDSSGAQQVWQLTDVSPALQAALLANRCFLVATQSADGNTTLFRSAGEVAFADWSFTPATDLSPTGQMLLFKFAPQSIATLSGQLASWTDAGTFNVDPNAAQTQLAALIAAVAQAANGTDPDLAALYAPLQAVLTDPSWNGVIAFGAPAAHLPAVVANLATAAGAGTLPALAVGVQINDIAGGGETAPSIARSAPFALVDYERPTPKTGGSSPAQGKPFGFALDHLRAGFLNGTLNRFTAAGRLEINELFGVPVALQTNGADAAHNIIALVGTYQQPTTPGAPGVYGFVAAAPASFRFAYDFFDGTVTAQVLGRIDVADVQFVPVTPSESRFALAGALTFNPPAFGTTPYLQTGGSDLFDFAPLAVADLGIVMTGADPNLAFAFDVTRTRFPGSGTTLRPGLAQDLPLTLQSLLPAGSLSALGATVLQVPSTWAPPQDAFDYAFAFGLDMGRPGALSPQSGSLSATFYLGWTAAGGYAAGLAIAGTGQANRIALDGVIELTFGAIALKPLTGDGASRLTIQLVQCGAGFLGVRAPGAAQQFDITLFGPPPYPAQTLLWFGAAGS